MSNGNITYFKNNKYRLRIFLLINENTEKAKAELREEISNDYQFYKQLKTMKIRGLIKEEEGDLLITKLGYETVIKLGEETSLIDDYYLSEMMNELKRYKDKVTKLEQERKIKEKKNLLLKGLMKSLDELIE